VDRLIGMVVLALVASLALPALAAAAQDAIPALLLALVVLGLLRALA
jgi:hypothetical protein